MENILTLNNLTKIIKEKEIVSNVDLNIKKGEIYGFVGPNGAGKTSVMKLITNIWKPTNGTIEIFGKRLTEKSFSILKRMGSIIEFPVFYEKLSGKDNLQLHCDYMGYYSPGIIDESLETLGLIGAKDELVGKYSLGMKQRLGIARAIITKPEILILDEPTNGLDPSGMKEIRDLLKILSVDYGITIMISSHLLSQIESIADTIGIINHGKMVKEISMREIENMNLSYTELKVEDTKRALYILADKLNLKNYKLIGEDKIRIYDFNISTREINKVLALNDVDILSIGQKSDNLEDYFLKITKEEDNA